MTLQVSSSKWHCYLRVGAKTYHKIKKTLKNTFIARKHNKVTDFDNTAIILITSVKSNFINKLNIPNPPQLL